MHEHDFLRRKFFGIGNERFTRRVRAELKLSDVAKYALCRLIGIERYFRARLRIAQDSGRRLRIGVANKKDRVPRIPDDASRKNIGESFWHHHSAGKRVNASGTRRRVPNGLTV